MHNVMSFFPYLESHSPQEATVILIPFGRDILLRVVIHEWALTEKVVDNIQ